MAPLLCRTVLIGAWLLEAGVAPRAGLPLHTGGMSSENAAPESENRSSSAIGSALAVLRCFSPTRPSLGVTEIASKVGLHKSSVSRMLTTLEQEDLVEQDPVTKRYRMGLGIISIAAPLLADLDVRRASLSVLQELTARVGETSALMMWNGSEAVVVEQVAPMRPIKHTSPLGTAYGTTNSSSVRAFLAAMPEEERDAHLRAGLLTPARHTNTWVVDMRAALQRERHERVSVNDGVSSPDEVGVASVVHDHRGEVVAAVLISAPRFRVDAERLADLVDACRAAAEDVTVRLGGA